MAFADSSSTRMAYVKEVVEGTTPASPAWKTLRYTGEQLQYQKQTVTSNEIRPDRNVSDVIQVGRQVSGSINFELSYATLDDLLEGVLGGTWATNVLKNGVTRHAFSFEKTFEQGATDSFLRYRGCLIGGMSLDITAQQIVTGSVNIMGLGGSAGTTALGSATYAAPNANPVLNASSDFASLAIGGVSPSPRIRSLSLQIENNLRAQPEVGNIDLAGIGLGRCVFTGRMEAYFESLALYNAILNHDDIDLAFTVGAGSGSKYTVTLPRIKLLNGDPMAGGNDQDVMLPIDFQAIYDASGSPAFGATMSVTRGVS
ncbi:conserved hypothetical protein [Hyphomicrobiales bacterium]|nr:conserved hypothetical protein [Hyphomicrobiales bacterium]CAH1664165.1 conserved hypothetical protein [Hyphomicrobiales bacterium]